MRIISICPSNTELLTYAGLIDQVIAVDDYSDWPEQINHLPRLGSDMDIDMNKVEELQPDLVYASLSVPGMEKNIEKLQQRNIPFVTVDNPKTLEEIGTVLETICVNAGRKTHGEKVNQKYQEFLKIYKERSQLVTNIKRVYWEWWPKPVFTPGRDNWLTELTELSGGENVFKNEEVASVKTNWEAVQKKNPDEIMLVWVGVQQKKVNTKVVINRSGSEEMKAVKENHIHILEEPFFCRPSPRLMIGLAQAAYLLHPEIFPEPTGREDELLYV